MKAAPVKRSPASVLDWNQVSPGFAEPSPAWAPPSAGRPRGQNVPPQQQAGQFGAGGAPKSPSLVRGCRTHSLGPAAPRSAAR